MIVNLILLITLLLASQACSLTSFEFAKFEQNTRGLYLEGDTYLSNGGLEITKNQVDVPVYNSSGRASYEYPVQLWDPRTRLMADIETHFTFSIKKLNEITDQQSGDGITFFLVPFDSVLFNDSAGGFLALYSPTAVSKNDSNSNRFVAVEFDTFFNEQWDPSSDHVGIDINSIFSNATMKWRDGTMKDGREGNAWVRYNSTSHNLSVFLTYDKDPDFSLDYYVLSYVVDLRDYLPERVRVGISGATGLCNETHTVFSWSFQSSLDLIENTTIVSPRPSPSPSPNSEKVKVSEVKGINGMAIGLGVGFGVVFSGLGFVWFVCWRKRVGSEIEEEKEYEESIEDEFEWGVGPKRFTYNELMSATGDFAEEGKLGEGGFGDVYKGLLAGEPNMEVAVKRISKESRQGKKAYVSEVKIISCLRHKNLVRLIGWCHTKGEFLLVYEFMPNGSLDTHLFGKEQTLTWTVRYKIAQGLASALLYLHEEWEQCVVHRDIKSSNVMLDSNFNAKLGDFGLARLADHESGLQTTILAGTMGYIAPECVSTGKASKESDVYSFGVVSLEICCGRRTVERNEDPMKTSILEWVWDLYRKGQILEAADARLSSDFNDKQMECLMVIGLWCCHPNPSFRPSIKHVMSVMNFEAPLPNIPSQLPISMYFAPQFEVNSSFFASSTAQSSHQN